jgi:AraC family transcriptional regulator
MQEAESDNCNGDLFLQTITTAICIHLLQNYSIQKHKWRDYKISSERLKKVLKYIDEHLDQSPCLEDLAKIAIMSKYHFCRAFKECLGVTPYQYFLERRLEKAVQFLKSRKYSLAELSLALGYSDQSHFNRHFKKRFGISPTKFLREI